MTANNDIGSTARPGGARGGHTLAERIRRLLLYTGVNITSVALDYAIFLPLTAATGRPVTASVVSYAAAFTLNYYLSRRLVFGSDGAHKGERRLFAAFMATGLLGVGLTALVTGIGTYRLDLNPAIAKTAAVLICFVTLYIVRSRLIFTRAA